MPQPAIQYEENNAYTYADYQKWDIDVRAELVDGQVYMMAAPNAVHQEVLGELFYRIRRFLEKKPCKVYPAPFSVRLFPQKDDSDRTVFEPDIVVICDPSKIERRGCVGAPELVIEILSPSTSSHDRITKFRRYRQGGIGEYWIVDPETRSVQVCILKDGQYVVSMYEDGESVPVAALPGLDISLDGIFPAPSDNAAEYAADSGIGE